MLRVSRKLQWTTLTTAGIAAVAVSLAVAAGTPAVSTVGGSREPDAEAAFREAREYTVRLRTRIENPFIEDEQGSFEGAGFLVDPKRGWIVTNAHVVGQSPSEVSLAFADEPFRPARKLYVDTFADIAVLEVDGVPPGRRAAVLGDSRDVQIGEAVGVFGHPLGMYFTGTRGIVSNQTDQDGPDLIQIDATIDHGNSGGPVIALRDRRVIGIATSGAGGRKADRLNFATPSRDLARILELLRAGVPPSPPRLGIALLMDEDGRHTMQVARSYDAERWPLLPEDGIETVDGNPVQTLSDLVGALRGRRDGAALGIERDGRRRDVTIRPEFRPAVVERRGLRLDGALIGDLAMDEDVTLREPLRLGIQEVAPGSEAGSLGLEPGDLLHRVDGREFTRLDSLETYLRARPAGRPVRLILRRFTASRWRVFDYPVRELPGTDLARVGDPPAAIASAP